MEFHREPLDIGFNIATRSIANRLNRTGWDEVEKFEDAPTTYEEVQAYYKQHGRLCIAQEASKFSIFDCEDTNVHYRAWHDAVHVTKGFKFNVAGEAATCSVQIAMLYRLYGDNPATRRWCRILLADTLGLVLYFQRNGTWPLDEAKRRIVEETMHEWDGMTDALLDCIGLAGPEEREQHRAAIMYVQHHWGNPY